mgnify:CR=1 FL=1
MSQNFNKSNDEYRDWNRLAFQNIDEDSRKKSHAKIIVIMHEHDAKRFENKKVDDMIYDSKQSCKQQKVFGTSYRGIKFS